MILDSSRHKLARAKKHVEDFKTVFGGFIDRHPYEAIAEPDAKHPENVVHKIRLTESIPDCLDVIAADAVNNMRSALDHACYAIARASGKVDPKNAAFPMSGSAAEFNRSAKGRCTDLPEEIFALFVRLQPYKGGNDALCALKDLSNADKHTLLTPVGTGMVRIGSKLKATGFVKMPLKPSWDRTKNEIVVFTTGPSAANLKYDFKFSLFVSFEDVEIVRGKDAIEVLDALVGVVERVLLAIEAEARRIGIV